MSAGLQSKLLGAALLGCLLLPTLRHKETGNLTEIKHFENNELVGNPVIPA